MCVPIAAVCPQHEERSLLLSRENLEGEDIPLAHGLCMLLLTRFSSPLILNIIKTPLFGLGFGMPLPSSLEGWRDVSCYSVKTLSRLPEF